MSSNLLAWAHWVLLDPDRDQDDVQMAKDAQALVTKVDRLERVKELAEAWLRAEDAFVTHMDEATTTKWYPQYADKHWDDIQACRENLRRELGKT